MGRRAVIVAGITAAVGTLVAQDHGYTPADIENGARLYQSTCAGCHGPAGDEIPGVELACVAIAAGSVLFVYALR